MMRAINIFMYFMIFIVSCNAIVVFEAYTTNSCTTRMGFPRPKTYYPVTDLPQGVDFYVGNQIYGGNPPATVGQFTDITSLSVTLCATPSSCQSWDVVTKGNISVCISTPCFGFGRFYNVPGPAVQMLERTGSVTAYDPTTCTDPLPYGWVAYYGEISPETAPCSSGSSLDTQWFVDGDKLTQYVPGTTLWSSAQPCGSPPYPGEKCFTQGTGYCMVNAKCSIDRTNAPTKFPFVSYGATSVKTATDNLAGLIAPPAGESATLNICLGLTVLCAILSF